jgi:hypothetical protein
MFERLYIVCWGASSCDDHGNAHANVGVHGVYSTKSAALKGLVECKDSMIADTKYDLDPDGEEPELLDNLDIEVYGSEAEEYFEIDYTIGTDPCEVRIEIVEQ